MHPSHIGAHCVRAVGQFHRKHDAPVGCAVANAEDWGKDVLILRKSLIYEEGGEIQLALHDQDQLELIDGLGDLLYVMAGAWVAVHGDDTYPPCDEKLRLKGGRPCKLWSTTFIQQIETQVGHCVKLAADFNEQPYPYQYGIHCAITALHNAGYDPVGVFDEIHSSNMTKTPTKGDIRVRVKGPDYRAPDLSRFLRGK